MDKITAVRGAVTVNRDCESEIREKSVKLIRELVARNKIGERSSCISVIISTTADIKSFYPARAIRESNLLDAPLFSCAEPDIDGALPLCIRVMLTLACDGDFTAEHVYLDGARALRPDLVGK